MNAQGVPVSMMRDGTPKGYMFLSFNGNQYAFDYRVAGQPETYKIGIHAPKVIARRQSGKKGFEQSQDPKHGQRNDEQ